MAHERARKFFGGIVSEDRISNPRHKVDATDYELVNSIMWDAFNGRGKRASKKVEHCSITDEYKPMYEEYEDISIDDLLLEVGECYLD